MQKTDPKRRPIWAWPNLFLTPKKDQFKLNRVNKTNLKIYSFLIFLLLLRNKERIKENLYVELANKLYIEKAKTMQPHGINREDNRQIYYSYYYYIILFFVIFLYKSSPYFDFFGNRN